MYIHVHTYFHFGMNFNHDVKKEGLRFLGNHTRPYLRLKTAKKW